MLQHHSDSALTHLRRELLGFRIVRHGSSLSRVGASGKPGAVQALIFCSRVRPRVKSSPPIVISIGVVKSSIVLGSERATSQSSRNKSRLLHRKMAKRLRIEGDAKPLLGTRRGLVSGENTKPRQFLRAVIQTSGFNSPSKSQATLRCTRSSKSTRTQRNKLTRVLQLRN